MNLNNPYQLIVPYSVLLCDISFLLIPHTDENT